MNQKTCDRYGLRLARSLDLWVKLARAFTSVQHVAEDHVRSFSLTLPQFGVLECLGHKGSLTFTELSRKQLVSGGNTTVVVDNLEKEGLVMRERCAEDRRQIYVRLTPKGRKLFDRMFNQHAELVAKIMSVLSPEEQERLAALLKKLGTTASAGNEGGDERRNRARKETERSGKD